MLKTFAASLQISSRARHPNFCLSLGINKEKNIQNNWIICDYFFHFVYSDIVTHRHQRLRIQRFHPWLLLSSYLPKIKVPKYRHTDGKLRDEIITCCGKTQFFAANHDGQFSVSR